MRWLELAREELADALDAAGALAPDVEADVRAVAAQDLALARRARRPRRCAGCGTTRWIACTRRATS